MTHDAYSTKRVTVWRQDKENFAKSDGSFINVEEGYAILYRDGYTSWCPKDVFERDYQPITAMSFGHAIHALKSGKRVARVGWNGKNMFLIFVTENWNGETNYSGAFPKDFVGYNPFIAMYTADNKLVPWLASQTDMLADDWQVVNEI